MKISLSDYKSYLRLTIGNETMTDSFIQSLWKLLMAYSFIYSLAYRLAEASG